MPTTGQLQLGLTEVYAPGTNTVIGYAFTEQSGKGQLQRWLLFRSPGNALDVRKPSPEALMTAGSLADWRRQVEQRWQQGCIYVWAQADVYSHGETSGSGTSAWTWTQLPPASKMPSPTYPAVDAEHAQLDPDCRAHEVAQGSCRGLVFTRDTGSIKAHSTVEYWLLPDQYEPAGGLKSVTVGAAGGSDVTLSEDPAQALQQFIDLSSGSWRPGCAFVITGCVNYTGQSAPADR